MPSVANAMPGITSLQSATWCPDQASENREIMAFSLSAKPADKRGCTICGKISVTCPSPPRNPVAARRAPATYTQYGYIWMNCQPFPHCNENAWRFDLSMGVVQKR
jgi:hypothetical protein